jgi:hypothetical protein
MDETWAYQKEVGGVCPLCRRLPRMFYDSRNTWAVCMHCRIGCVVGLGCRVPPGMYNAATEAHLNEVAWQWEPPPGATYTRALFWLDLGHVIGGKAIGWPDRETIVRLLESDWAKRREL